MALQTRDLSASDSSRWDAFVRAHPLGSPFHLTAWVRTIEKTYGFRSYSFLAEEDGELRGLLPLFLVSNLLMGKVLLSSPYAVYGGILADSAESRAALAEHVANLGRSLNVQYVELRNGYPEQCAGFSPIDRYVTFYQEIDGDPARTLETIPRKTRRMVRKALSNGLSSRSTRRREVFFDLYSRNLRRLGTPCFPRAHFKHLFENFGDDIDIREIVLNGEVVAAVLSLYFRDQALPYYGASNPRYNEFAPNNFMYYDMMVWAGQNGYKLFDFGRSKKGSGSFDFKAHWGMQVRDLPYEVLLIRRKQLPNFSPANPKFQLATRLWQSLPLPLTRAVGPWLLKLVP